MAKTKLKMTLPKEFLELRGSGLSEEEYIQKAKEYLESCHPDARERGGDRNTALHLRVPLELANWLVERGANVNITNNRDETPLFYHAERCNYKMCKYLLEHGADVNTKNYSGRNVVFWPAVHASADVVELLLEHGADPSVRDEIYNRTSLTDLLATRTSSMPHKNVVRMAEILIKARRERGGIPDEEWKEAQRYVAKTGHNYNLRIDDFPCDTEEERRKYGEAMQMLYELFDVEPVAPIIKHDGKEPITVDETLSVKKQYNALWDYLVPGSGACKNVQGEVIRVTGRVDDEIYRNGAANWDKDYKKMLLALPDYFRQGNPLNEEDMQKAQESIDLLISCRGYGEWDEPDKLCALAVKWVKQNPEPIPLGKVNYRR